MTAAKPLSFGTVQGRIVFFEHHSGRYLGLSAELSALLDACRFASGSPVPSPVSEALRKSGVECDQRSVLMAEECTVATPTRALDTGPLRHPVSWRNLFAAGSALIAVWIRLRRGHLDRLIIDAPVQRMLSPGTITDFDRISELVAAFRVCRLLTGSHNHCLWHALSLRRLLATYHVDSLLIFGVKLGPFAAHSWLQIGDTVIGDTVDRVRNFTPVHAL